jgi:hypothetical protein
MRGGRWSCAQSASSAPADNAKGVEATRSKSYDLSNFKPLRGLPLALRANQILICSFEPGVSGSGLATLPGGDCSAI